MQLPLPWKTRSPIGVEIGSRSLRAVQLVREQSTWIIDAMTVVDRGDDDALAADVKRLVESLSRRGFAGRDVVLAAPHDLLIRSEFDIDASADDQRVTDKARRELAAMGKAATDELQIGWWTLPQCGPPDRKNILAVGCRESEAEQLLSCFDDAGLSVIALETPAQALARWTERFLPSRATTFIALNVGWRATYLSFVLDGRVAFERMIPGGSVESMHTTIRNQFGFDANEIDVLLTGNELDTEAGGADLANKLDSVIDAQIGELREEIVSTVQYLSQRFSGRPMDLVVLLGEGAAIRGLDERIASAIDMRVDRPTLATQEQCHGAAEEHAGHAALAIATGLASRTEGVAA
ncbi:MAG: pilus assembly protein PilM [Planctomycetota bacterium]